MKINPKNALISLILSGSLIGAGSLILKSQRPPTPSLSPNLTPNTAQRPGNPQAKVKLTEHVDYQCEACAAFMPVLNELMSQYPNELEVIFRHNPLPGHEFAYEAALAAEAAGKQGKFWEMSKLILENQNNFAEKPWLDLAKSLNLDVNKFTQDLASDDVKNKIIEDQNFAQKLGVLEAPVFFLNEQRLPYPKTYDELKKQVAQEVMKNYGDKLAEKYATSYAQLNIDQPQPSLQNEPKAFSSFELGLTALIWLLLGVPLYYVLQLLGLQREVERQEEARREKKQRELDEITKSLKQKG